VDLTSVTGSKRDRAQLQGFSSRRVHHLEEDSSIWAEEKDLEERDFWVSFVCHRASFLVYPEEFYLPFYLLELGQVGGERGALQKVVSTIW
jgi:hypothetical protein